MALREAFKLSTVGAIVQQTITQQLSFSEQMAAKNNPGGGGGGGGMDSA